LIGKVSLNIQRDFFWFHRRPFVAANFKHLPLPTMAFPLLDTISSPVQLRSLAPSKLAALCQELRQFLLEKTRTKAGHIKSSLGVTELTVALHYVYKTPKDILIWDVGHQAYVHKIITDRKDRFHTNRLKNGITGFTNRQESPFDPFGAGHSSTSVSALAGFWKAGQLSQKQRKYVAVIGDGALTGGMAFEALNYLGEQQANCLIILNDNKSSIDPNVGALNHLNSYQAFAESLGFSFHEVTAGNDVQALVNVLQDLKKHKGPVFLKVRTQKGLGFRTFESHLKKTEVKTFQNLFGQKVHHLMAQDPRVVVLSPAMLSGADLKLAQAAFPERVIDVGIAEQHVVTMAAGLAADGYYPIVHLYSTFAQRALDQIIHDVVLQKLPVLFCLDRAGLVGADGPTHHGVFDISLLASLPHLELWAPASGLALAEQLEHCVSQRKLAAIRYPKDEVAYEIPPLDSTSLAPSWWKKGHTRCVVSYGSLAAQAQAAVQNSEYAHLNIPCLKPFPAQVLQSLLAPFQKLITVEENMAQGGLGACVQQMIAQGSWSGTHRALGLPDQFVGQGSRQELLTDCQLDAAGIAAALKHL